MCARDELTGAPVGFVVVGAPGSCYLTLLAERAVLLDLRCEMLRSGAMRERAVEAKTRPILSGHFFHVVCLLVG